MSDEFKIFFPSNQCNKNPKRTRTVVQLTAETLITKILLYGTAEE